MISRPMRKCKPPIVYAAILWPSPTQCCKAALVVTATLLAINIDVCKGDSYHSRDISSLSEKAVTAVRQAVSESNYCGAIDMWYKMSNRMLEEGLPVSRYHTRLALLTITQSIDRVRLEMSFACSSSCQARFRYGLFCSMLSDYREAYDVFVSLWMNNTNDFRSLEQAVDAAVMVIPSVLTNGIYDCYMKECTNAAMKRRMYIIKASTEKNYDIVLDLYTNLVAQKANTPLDNYLAFYAYTKLKMYEDSCRIGNDLLNDGYVCNTFARLLGSVAGQNGRFHLACRAYKMALDKGQKIGDMTTCDSTSMTYYAIALQRTGNTNEACKYYRRAVSIDNSNAFARTMLKTLSAEAHQSTNGASPNIQ